MRIAKWVMITALTLGLLALTVQDGAAKWGRGGGGGGLKTSGGTLTGALLIVQDGDTIELDAGIDLNTLRVAVNSGNVFTLDSTGALQTTSLTVDSDGLRTLLSIVADDTTLLGVDSSGAVTIRRQNAVAATQTDGLILLNQEAATTGNQKYSPQLRFRGYGTATTPEPDESQSVDWVIYNQPVQGAANPTGNLIMASSINGEGYTVRSTLTSTGALTVASGITSLANQILASPYGATTPSLGIYGDVNTGLAWNTADQPVMCAGGKEMVRYVNGTGVDSIFVAVSKSNTDSLACWKERSAVGDDAEIVFETGRCGWGEVMIGDNQEWASFRFSTTGVVTLIANTTNVANTDSDANLCVYDAGTGIAVKNRLGSTLTIALNINYYTP